MQARQRVRFVGALHGVKDHRIWTLSMLQEEIHGEPRIDTILGEPVMVGQVVEEHLKYSWQSRVLISSIGICSASGIGRAIALRFAEEGVDLVVCADLAEKPSDSLAESLVETKDSIVDGENGLDNIQESSPGAKMVEDARKLYVESSKENWDIPTHELICQRYGFGRSMHLKCDVSLEDGEVSDGLHCVKDAIRMAVEETGKLDIIVNCAGGILDTSFLHQAKLAQWERTFAVDSRGAFLGSKYAIEQFLEQNLDSHGIRGCILNISSVAGLAGLPGCAAYCAAKASVLGLSRLAAVEYADQGIRSNCICPGYIYTPLLHRLIKQHAPEIGFSWLEKASPTNRLGQTKDIAEAAVWLASNKESGYVTGIELPVDGGFLAR